MKKRNHQKKGVSVAPRPADKKGLSAAGLSFFRQRRYREAIETLHKALKLGADPEISRSLAEAYFQYGLSFHQQESPDKAVVPLQQAVKHNPERAVYHFHVALAYHKAGECEQALSWYQQAAQLEPDDQRFAYHLALATIAAGGTPKSGQSKLKGPDKGEALVRTLLLRLLQGRPVEMTAPAGGQRSGRVALLYGVGAWMTGDREKAKALLAEAAKVDPTDPWCRCCLGIAAAAGGDPARAAGHLDGALGAMSGMPLTTRRGLKGLYVWLARWHVAEGRLSLAIAVLHQLLKLAPKDETARSNIAHAYFLDGNRYIQQNDTEGAIERWEKALEHRPGDAGALHNLALAFDRLEEYDKALVYWSRVTEVWKRRSASKLSLALAHRHLGNTYDSMGFVDKAAAEYWKALTYQRDDVGTWLTLAGLYLDNEMPWEAIKLLGDAIAAVPRNVELLNCLANAYDEDCDMRGVARCRKSILEIEPDNAAAREQFVKSYLGWADEEASDGRLSKALEIMKEAEHEVELLGISDYRVLVMLGSLHLRGKAHVEAERAYLRACSLEPANPLVYRIVGADYLRNGSLQRADRYFMKAIMCSPNDPALFLSIGAAYWRNGKSARGNGFFERAIQLRSNDPHIFLDIALLLGKEHRGAAAAYLKRALRLDKGLAEAHLALGAIALSDGDLVKARKSVSKARGLAEQQGDAELLETIEGVETAMILRSLPDRNFGAQADD